MYTIKQKEDSHSLLINLYPDDFSTTKTLPAVHSTIELDEFRTINAKKFQEF